jgi:hypothetical protein
MKNILYKILGIGIFLLCIHSTYAQPLYSNSYNYSRSTGKFRLKLLQRMDIGFHAGFSKSFFDETNRMGFTGWDENTQSEITTYAGESNSFKLKNSSYGGNIGFFIPIGYVVPYTRFALNVEAYVTSSSYTIQDYKVLGQAANPPAITSLNVTIPIGFDIKWGAQATLDRYFIGSVALGGGIAPTYHTITPVSTGTEQATMVVRPYLKAEFGFFTGIFWKIKGTMLYNNTNTLGHWVTGNANAVAPGAPFIDQSIKLGKYAYMLGIGFNIGSMKWNK